MHKFPLKLEKSLELRKQENAYRQLSIPKNLVDFSSNDYLGFATSAGIYKKAGEILKKEDLVRNGAAGSRLLTGNHILFQKAETFLAEFHQAEAALIFNSGYDANIGLFSTLPSRGDLIFYDELVHASIRDGIRMSRAKSYKFRHNDVEDLSLKIKRFKASDENADHPAKARPEPDVYIVTESVFSMDGDVPDLKSFAALAENSASFLIVDEAHATGVFGERGEGLIQQLGIEEKLFARINTFGKAAGCHGAVILGTDLLKDYLVNFARSFIYTTALPPHALATVLAAYGELEQGSDVIKKLRENIMFFKNELRRNDLEPKFIESHSAIQSCIISGNEKVKYISRELGNAGFEVKAILSPTVPKGSERLRFCLHSYNSKEEICDLIKVLATLVNKQQPSNKF